MKSRKSPIERENCGQDIVKTVNEKVGISEDVELKKLLEKDQQLQKQVEEIDKKTREEDEALQSEIASLLEEPY
jgi:hypothetical protein